MEKKKIKDGSWWSDAKVRRPRVIATGLRLEHKGHVYEFMFCSRGQNARGWLVRVPTSGAVPPRAACHCQGVTKWDTPGHREGQLHPVVGFAEAFRLGLFQYSDPLYINVDVALELDALVDLLGLRKAKRIA